MEILGYRQLISHPFHGIYSPSSPREGAKGSRQRIAMKTTAFGKVKDQVGRCGIWCGSCIVGNGTLKDLTGGYEKLIKDYDLEKWAPKTFDFKEFLSDGK